MLWGDGYSDGFLGMEIFPKKRLKLFKTRVFIKFIEVEIINLKQLQNFCYKELNYKISKKEITEVYENINSVPFWKRT